MDIWEIEVFFFRRASCIIEMRPLRGTTELHFEDGTHSMLFSPSVNGKHLYWKLQKIIIIIIIIINMFII